MSYLEEIKKKYDITDYKETPVTIPELPQDGIVLIVGTPSVAKSCCCLVDYEVSQLGSAHPTH